MNAPDPVSELERDLWLEAMIKNYRVDCCVYCGYDINFSEYIDNNDLSKDLTHISTIDGSKKIPTFLIKKDLNKTNNAELRDGLKIVGEGINNLRTPERGYLIVTHYQRLLEYVNPDFVHVFIDGNIVETGAKDLSNKLEKEGYESYL